MTAAMKVAGLTTAYRIDGSTILAIDRINLSLAQGEILGIVGESGSGKTTLGLSLLGLIKPPGRILEGVAELGGTDLLQLPGAKRAAVRGVKIGLVPQASMNALNPIFTARRLVEECVRAHRSVPHSAQRELAEAALEDVQLPPDVINRFPHELSGGMRQRVALAMALVNAPEVLIADEPTTGLDVIVQAGLISLLRRIQEERRLSIVLISHDLPMVSSIANRVAVLHEGILVEEGPTKDVIGQPRHAYSRHLIDSVPTLGDESARPRVTDGRTLNDDAPILDGKSLEKRYRVGHGLLGAKSNVPAVRGVDVQLHRGESLGLVGESGSGKTTIGRLLAGLITPDGGSVTLDGHSFSNISARRRRSLRRRVQLVFQDPYQSLSTRMSVAELVAEPLVIHEGGSRRGDVRVPAALEEVGLSPPEDFLQRHVGTLSGGQRQRVALARALILRPDVVIADEPTSMLDASLRASLLNTMTALRERHGIAFLFITHDLASAWLFCDRISVLFDGRVVESGATAKVIRTPCHPYTQALVDAAESFKPPERLESYDRASFAGHSGCAYLERCPWAFGDCTERPPLAAVNEEQIVACHIPFTDKAPDAWRSRGAQTDAQN